MMIIADAMWTSGEDTFTLNLPNDFIFYERSFSHHMLNGGSTDFYINDDLFSEMWNTDTNYGLVLPSELPTSMDNTIKIIASGPPQKACDAILLIYKE
jgi:hypothetical protein